jgi:hypothetical protein
MNIAMSVSTRLNPSADRILEFIVVHSFLLFGARGSWSVNWDLGS